MKYSFSFAMLDLVYHSKESPFTRYLSGNILLSLGRFTFRESLTDIVKDFDQRLLTIKGWGVTLSLASLGLGFPTGCATSYKATREKKKKT
jgi:hypothetical protein